MQAGDIATHLLHFLYENDNDSDHALLINSLLGRTASECFSLCDRMVIIIVVLKNGDT
jgi:hypothetical protein